MTPTTRPSTRPSPVTTERPRNAAELQEGVSVGEGSRPQLPRCRTPSRSCSDRVRASAGRPPAGDAGSSSGQVKKRSALCSTASSSVVSLTTMSTRSVFAATTFAPPKSSADTCAPVAMPMTHGDVSASTEPCSITTMSDIAATKLEPPVNRPRSPRQAVAGRIEEPGVDRLEAKTSPRRVSREPRTPASPTKSTGMLVRLASSTRTSARPCER